MRTIKGMALVAALILTQGCVSSSKHKELESQHRATNEELAKTREGLSNAEAKIGEQNSYIKELESRIGQGTNDRKKLESSLSETKKALEELAKRKQEAEKRIAEFSQLASRFKSLVDSGKLSVKMVDGRMVVALSSDVLFPSGSARLSPAGQAAIQEVTQLLASLPGKKYQVEGHTDNVPIKTAQYPSNWELASARSLTVVNTMLAAGMAPDRVSAASFGEHKPAQANDTPEGKTANRRIEIVVVPDLSSLPGYDQLQKYSTDAQAAN